MLGCDRSTPRILVDMDVFDGLLADMEIIWDQGSIILTLDY